jgi:hypothetical protein
MAAKSASKLKLSGNKKPLDTKAKIKAAEKAQEKTAKPAKAKPLKKPRKIVVEGANKKVVQAKKEKAAKLALKDHNGERFSATSTASKTASAKAAASAKADGALKDKATAASEDAKALDAAIAAADKRAVKGRKGKEPKAGKKVKLTPLEKYQAKQNKKMAKEAAKQAKELGKFKKDQGKLREQIALKRGKRSVRFKVLITILIVIVALIIIAAGLFALMYFRLPGAGVLNKVAPSVVSKVESLRPTVAATVDGQPIYEQDVSDYIQNYRTIMNEQYGSASQYASSSSGSTSTADYTTQSGFDSLLTSRKFDHTSYRSYIIKSVFVPFILTDEWASSLGLQSSQADAQKTFDDMRSSAGYDSKPADWTSLLQAHGYPNDAYFCRVLLQASEAQKIGATLAPFDPTAYGEPKKTDSDAGATVPTAESAASDYVNDFRTYVKDNIKSYCKTNKIAKKVYDPSQKYDYKKVPEVILKGDGTAPGMIAGWQNQETADSDVLSNGTDQIKTLTVGQKAAYYYQLYQRQDNDAAGIIINPMPTGLPYGEPTIYDANGLALDSSGKVTFTDEKKGLEMAKKDGLTWQDTKVGTGAELKLGQYAETLYILKLDDGTLVQANTTDSKTLEKGQPEMYMQTGTAGTVVEGWKWGLIGMKVGGIRELTVPSVLGYGSAGNGTQVPPNATLHFTVTLQKVSDKDLQPATKTSSTSSSSASTAKDSSKSSSKSSSKATESKSKTSSTKDDSKKSSGSKK